MGNAKARGCAGNRPAHAELHVLFKELTYIDHACLDLLVNWEKQHQAMGGDLVVDWDQLTTRFHRQGSNGKVSPAGAIEEPIAP